MTLRRSIFIFVCFPLLFFGCWGDEPPPPRVVDLVARFPVAQVTFESDGGASADTESSEAPRPVANAGAGRLYLPWQTRVDFYFQGAAGTRLQISSLRLRGRGAGELSISMTTDGEGEREVATVIPSPEQTIVPLPVTGSRTPVQLTLRAAPADSLKEGGGVWILQPRLLLPPDPDAGAEPAPETQSERPPHLFVYLIDTLRPDYLGCYGHEGGLTPNIDRFAAQATVFENAIGQSSWTRASVASLFTGLWPGSHRTNVRSDKLPDEMVTLPEILGDLGYGTAAFLANPNLREEFGFDQGFDVFEYFQQHTKSDVIGRRALEWLEGQDLREPQFVYVHTMDPHDPYLPVPEFRERFAPGTEDLVRQVASRPRRDTWKVWPTLGDQFKALYSAEIAFNDQSFGEFVQALREAGLYDDAFVVLLSDHGEEFGEHGEWTHGFNLHDDSLDVAFIVKFPNQRLGGRSDELVQHIDFVPTLTTHLGIDPPVDLEGRSLLHLNPEAAGTKGPASGPIYSYLDLDKRRSTSVIDGDWKLIVRARRNGTQRSLYNRAVDPGEFQNRFAAYPVRAATLDTQLKARLLLSTGPGEAAIISKELDESLRALGYLN